MIHLLLKPGWKLNPDEKVYKAITKAIDRNGGACPCHNKYAGTPDAMCPCKAYREEDHCCCSLYVKINQESDSTK